MPSILVLQEIKQLTENFPAEALEEIGFTRWVTSCPGVPAPGKDDALSEARSSRKMREYLKRLGY